MHRLDRLKQLRKPAVSSLNRIEVSQSAILHNLSYLQQLHPDVVVFPVLKSNAYGHGLQQLSQILRQVDLPYICVDSFPEYQIVRRRSGRPVLVIGETMPDNYRYYHPRDATLAVYNLTTIRRLVEHSRHGKIHLFLNTGMNREGIQQPQLSEVVRLVKQAPDLEVEGVMSHFATADEIDSSLCEEQVDTFHKMSAVIKHAGLSPRWYHIANSAGLVKVDDGQFNAARCGIALYGYNHLHPSDADHAALTRLQPALRVLSTVVSSQQIEPGDTVSYGARYEATQQERSVTLPFGYREGLRRSLSDRRQVKWHEHYLPVIGTICMNLTCLATQGTAVDVGDQVEIIGTDPAAPNSIATYATLTETIPYEVLVNLDDKIRRVVVT